MHLQDTKRPHKRTIKPCVLFLALLPCLAAMSLTAQAAEGAGATARFDIPQQKLGTALSEYARQSGTQLLYSPELANGKTAPAVRGEKTPRQALDELLAGTGLNYSTSASGAILIGDAAAGGASPSETSRSGEKQGNVQEVAETQPTATSQETLAEPTAPATTTSPARASSATTLDTIVVTAQKKVENIQKVPISISAFGGKDLGDRKIETGGDLVTATPNVTFSKTNFASYNFQIRGIGTQALSVTTDPAVAVSFNSTPLIRNRLFEQEYLDVERVEVLRGPQGTLYGRNATAGVVNMIPNLANPEAFEADVKGEIGNYDTRRVSGMVNVPLSDAFAFRLATQYTKRDGYDENTVTGKDVNDRDLLSVRTSLAFKPSDRFSASFVWEHFQEDDNRSRTGKQLCHNDPGPVTIGSTTVSAIDRNYLSQGCTDGSLYDQGAYGVPNGGSIPFILGAQVAPVGFRFDADGNYVDNVYIVQPGLDPYGGLTQSRDMRKIATDYDPKFKATNDIFQLNLDADVSDHLKLVSQTVYTRDQYYSTQDYGRFQSRKVFSDTSTGVQYFGPDGTLVPVFNALPGGVYCDPQLGCSDRMLMADLVDSDAKQWSQEFRLQSSFDGAFNFSLGANYLEYKVDESYYVFNNLITALADLYFNGTGAGNPPSKCPAGSATRFYESLGEMVPCVYIDPNPIGSINGQGHNYFRSRNVAETKSAAIFGEGYWKLSDTVRLTAGVRFTNDRKITTPYPSQTLLSDSTGTAGLPLLFGGYVGYGYPALPKITQTWNEPTGRLVLDWSPDLSFTDSTMFYASASRGYKAGGTNSPGIAANPIALTFEQRNPEFKPEFVNAFEMGMKNVMAGGKFVLNGTLFYNDYKDYQVSQIQDRATFNENFDAKTWGAELEAVWRPTEAFQLSGNVGLLRTRIGSNQYSIDVIDRTAGNSDWVVVKPWLQLASNCIAPKEYVEAVLQGSYPLDPPYNNAANVLNSFCATNLPLAGGGFGPGGLYDGSYGFTYDPAKDAPNGGAGFAKNVGGNELPNAPHITVSLSPQYTFMTGNGDFTVRADLYYQGPSWARIYQDKIDRLSDWGNVNVSLTWNKIESDLSVQLYVKNALGGKAITGTFVNSDDTGLGSNVFIQDPRIIGLSVRKGFF
ncbi:TonB-dependent receptor domain-containing protein [Lysobacter sp. CA199]|uniref:TonB-dependent receptor domain-containing protein n=1 Tax=Lysobacter sp. CA199 TaxID=3455608 RepID=UPI003F8D69F2